jgi:hypothetical protein
MAFGHVPYFDSDPQKCRLQILKHTDPHLIIPQVQERYLSCFQIVYV